jgi:hypothetical protein
MINGIVNEDLLVVLLAWCFGWYVTWDIVVNRFHARMHKKVVFEVMGS